MSVCGQIFRLVLEVANLKASLQVPSAAETMNVGSVQEIHAAGYLLRVRDDNEVLADRRSGHDIGSRCGDAKEPVNGKGSRQRPICFTGRFELDLSESRLGVDVARILAYVRGRKRFTAQSRIGANQRARAYDARLERPRIGLRLQPSATAENRSDEKA